MYAIQLYNISKIINRSNYHVSHYIMIEAYYQPQSKEKTLHFVIVLSTVVYLPETNSTCVNNCQYKRCFLESRLSITVHCSVFPPDIRKAKNLPNPKSPKDSQMFVKLASQVDLQLKVFNKKYIEIKVLLINRKIRRQQPNKIQLHYSHYGQSTSVLGPNQQKRALVDSQSDERQSRRLAEIWQLRILIIVAMWRFVRCDCLESRERTARCWISQIGRDAISSSGLNFMGSTRKPGTLCVVLEN